MKYFVPLVLFLILGSECSESQGNIGEEVKLRDEADVEKLREEALSKFDVPIDKMKIKDLKKLLSDRGVTCTACSEKSQLVETVRNSIHLPIKKDHLKKINMPREMGDSEMESILKELKKKQEQDKQMKDMLKKQGFNTDGMNFGNNMDAEVMEKLMQNLKKDNPV